ncbi:MAG TPA: glycoside hydrolase family 32 protein [Candidatus Eisenbergiella merdipullorum]|uniref:Sucrose-6-phosphate hydrolase n=1 Tax=Candidatus Eisenbergiella merdipullorum TaxID=2838553 RepID=A0A9D2I542_9FIRM|nr:glycoside hydrolase family 32 protein [Candidatus Eisenbergiella merdipullorum]
MSSEKLNRAREYEKREAVLVPEEQRPAFHLSVPTGWMNDPNGFSFFQGWYHLFFQYNPYGTGWDAMHWGHARTQDLIRWEYLPAALAPDEDYDSFGVFSGSAIEEDGKHVLLYTGVSEKEDADGKKEVRQVQCLAVGDGVDYEKIPENPVIDASLLPEGSSREDFRDPKLWKEDGIFYAVAGSRAADGSGQIALFSSEDLKNWKFVTILDRSENRIGRMWECPDFFPAEMQATGSQAPEAQATQPPEENTRVLIISPQDVMAKWPELHNGNNALFLIGDYEKKNHVFRRHTVQSADYGLDYYAPQTVEAPDGRRILIAWMKSWDTNIFPEGYTWNGMMTVPREVTVRDGRVLQNPVRELEQYHGEPVCVEQKHVHEPVSFPGINGRTADLQVEIEGRGFGKFTVSLAKNGRWHTDLIYDEESGVLTFDRTCSGLRRDVVCSRSMPVPKKDGKVRLRILLDKYSVEVFANDGECVMTSLITTPQEADGICFSSENGVQADIRMYPIEISR